MDQTFTSSIYNFFRIDVWLYNVVGGDV